jgi:hypothetical protein
MSTFDIMIILANLLHPSLIQYHMPYSYQVIMNYAYVCHLQLTMLALYVIFCIYWSPIPVASLPSMPVASTCYLPQGTEYFRVKTVLSSKTPVSRKVGIVHI